MLYPSRRTIVRPTNWAVLAYTTVVLFIVLTTAGYGSPIAGELGSLLFGFLGLFSVFLGTLLWDTLRTGGLRVSRIYGSAGYILITFGLITVLGLAYQFHPNVSNAYHIGAVGNGEQLVLYPFLPLVSFCTLFFAVSFAAIPTVIRHYRSIFVLILLTFAATVLANAYLYPTESLSGRAAGIATNPNS